MRKWEYQMTRHSLKDLPVSETGNRGTAFFCSQKGQCLLHDASDQAAEKICQVLNEEGEKGWELVQFGYHLGECLCIWKKAID